MKNHFRVKLMAYESAFEKELLKDSGVKPNFYLKKFTLGIKLLAFVEKEFDSDIVASMLKGSVEEWQQ